MRLVLNRWGGGLWSSGQRFVRWATRSVVHGQRTALSAISSCPLAHSPCAAASFLAGAPNPFGFLRRTNSRSLSPSPCYSDRARLTASKHLQRHGSLWRRKQAVEFSHCGDIQRVRQGVQVFGQPRLAGRLRNCNLIVFCQQPAQRGLRGRHAVALCKIGQLAIARQGSIESFKGLPVLSFLQWTMTPQRFLSGNWTRWSGRGAAGIRFRYDQARAAVSARETGSSRRSGSRRSGA